MAKSKSEMNKAKRKKRKADGLVELRLWLTVANREKVREFIEMLKG